MEAILNKIELLCWRSVPTLMRTELFGEEKEDEAPASSQEAEQERVFQRFRVLTRCIDRMFGQKIRSTDEEIRVATWGLESSITTLLASLPGFFTAYKEFWPTELLLQTLLVANSRRIFSESPDFMALVSLY